MGGGAKTVGGGGWAGRCWCWGGGGVDRWWGCLCGVV